MTGNSRLDIEVIEGNMPIILTQPHAGTWLPADLRMRLQDHALELCDTDWHIPRLYDDLLPAATIVRTPVHRYVIDVNRPPDNTSLYPGSHGTGLCPLSDFDGQPLYRPDQKPDAEEISQRRQRYYQPYHDAIAEQIRRLQQHYPELLVYDCHSIRSHIPALFVGQLPVFNIGSNNDQSCAPALTATVAATVAAACAQAEQTTEQIAGHDTLFDHVVNGRFRGGHTIRHYAQPQAGIHALQMELAQRAYMSEQPPWKYDEAAAQKLRPVLREVLGQALQWLVQRRA